LNNLIHEARLKLKNQGPAAAVELLQKKSERGALTYANLFFLNQMQGDFEAAASNFDKAVQIEATIFQDLNTTVFSLNKDEAIPPLSRKEIDDILKS